jgi:replicative superfamily II helicase
VFAKLGNFPAISFLVNKNKNQASLPLINQVELLYKQLVQQVPDSENLVFTDSQYELFSKISNSTEFSFSGPTSMGKSFLIKSFIKKVIRNSPPENICIVVPTRALINQFSIDLKLELKVPLEQYRYRILTNSNVSEVIIDEGFNYILVLTPERLISYISQINNPKIGFLFIDEAHKLASQNDHRSVTTYTAIEKVQKRYGYIKLYFSSPNVSNPEVFLKLFDRVNTTNSYSTDESPVAQNLYFVDLLNKTVELHLNNKILNVGDGIDISSISNEIEFIAKVGKNRNNLIYCNSKRHTIEKAIEFAEKTDKIKINDSIARAIKNITTYIHPDYYLADLLEKGVAYHYGKLPQVIRILIEDLYKQEHIQNVFCTSTLLEGINMPTKNVFILDNRNGRSKLEPIDFWNLSGRAGRLAKELEGNIFCVQYEGFTWDNKSIFKKEKINLKPTVLNRIDRNLIKIEKILESKNISGSETEKEILKYISNIIKSDTLEIESNYQSPIINKLIEKNKLKIIDLALEKTKDYSIPNSILNFNQTIDFTIQNNVYLTLLNSTDKITLPSSSSITYEICLMVLNKLYDLYSWQSAEKKLNKRESLTYYSLLMNQWINGFSLNQIISQSIDWKDRNNGNIMVSFNEYELFNKKNKKHINLLIEYIIDDIEYVLRFLLEKYFNHYYQIVAKIKGSEGAGENWATLLEYGTQNRIVIALQNIGISRNTAIKIYRNHPDCLNIINGKLSSVNKQRLLDRMDQNSLDYNEIIRVL